MLIINFLESWIEFSSIQGIVGPRTPERITPLPFSSGDEYLRLLKEAQRESNQSSRVVSLAGSRKASPRDRLVYISLYLTIVYLKFSFKFIIFSPKSPPNSPNTELCNEEELKGIYINYWNKVCLFV